MQPAITLKQKIQSGNPTLGTLISNHLWPELIEMSMEAGLDYVIIDAEHFDPGAERIAEACRLGRVAKFPVLMRPARTDTESIRIAMDLGPCGLLLPMIESAAQMDAVRDGVYLPPRGKRRPGGPANRWVKRYNYDAFKRDVEDHVIIIPQIEGTTGLRNAAEIAAHPLTTALGVGPFDLSASLGFCGQGAHPTVSAAISKLRTAAADAGKPMWMIGDTDEMLADGYTFLCIGEPSGILQSAMMQIVTKARSVSRLPNPAPRGNNGMEVYTAVSRTLVPKVARSTP